MKLRDKLLIGASIVCSTLAVPMNLQADSVWKLPAIKSIPKEVQEISSEKGFEEYYGFGNNSRKNKEILSNLSREEFRNLTEKTNFDWLKKITGRIRCDDYAYGRERVEHLRDLEEKINMHIQNRLKLGGNVSAWQVLVTIGIENGGRNEINCEEGGGIMHLLYRYNQDINLLNVDQNLFKGLEQMDRLNKLFNDDEKTTVLGYNLGETRVGEIKNKIVDHLKYNGIEDPKPTYDQIMWLLSKENPAIALNGKKHVERYFRFSNKIKKERLFEYNPENNTLKYIGPEEGLPFRQPRPSPKKEINF